MGLKKWKKCPNQLEALVLLAKVWTLSRHFLFFWTLFFVHYAKNRIKRKGCARLFWKGSYRKYCEIPI